MCFNTSDQTILLNLPPSNLRLHVISRFQHLPTYSEQSTKTKTIGSESGEELLDFEKALAMPRRPEKVSSTVTSIRSGGDSKVCNSLSELLSFSQRLYLSEDVLGVQLLYPLSCDPSAISSDY